MAKWLVITLIFEGIFLLFVILSAIGKVHFKRKASKEAGRLLEASSENNTDKICQEDLLELPHPVQKWLINSHMIGKEKIRTVRLKQTGRLRMKENGPWMTFKAVQYYSVDKPGFVWNANVKMAPLFYLSGIDHYYDGKGKMNIKLLSLFPVVDAKGKEITQATMVRFLAEICWFPSAAVNSYIKWEAIDANSARATMTYKGESASGVFTFNNKGDMIRFDAKRHRKMGDKYILRDWVGVNQVFSEFNGIRIPSRSGIIWKEKAGDFNWLQCEIVDVEYNKSNVY